MKANHLTAMFVMVVVVVGRQAVETLIISIRKIPCVLHNRNELVLGRFESEMGHRLSDRDLSWLSSAPTGKIQGQYFTLGHGNFLPHPFPFIIH
jgi:hypothetical protein